MDGEEKWSFLFNMVYLRRGRWLMIPGMVATWRIWLERPTVPPLRAFSAPQLFFSFLSGPPGPRSSIFNCINSIFPSPFFL